MKRRTTIMNQTLILAGRLALTIHLVLLAAPGLAGGDIELGKQKAAQICAACHNLNGQSQNPIYPHIGGQYKDYLLHALRGYKSGARQNAIMQGMVATLTDDDLKNLAAYYAMQESPLRKAP
jgi:cytochrome c553